MSPSADLLVSRAIDDALTLAAASVARDPARSAPDALSVAVALSGGRDSMVLLDALAEAVVTRAFSLSAVHVHHGLSPNADRWTQFCADECARRDIPLAVHRVRVDSAASLGIEAAARAARYRAFESIAADFVALAHHAEDQAETLLLQMLRGSGPHGLAAMPPLRAQPRGGALLRPFISLPGAAIDAYAKSRKLAWIEDESNADRSLKRNFLRHEISPRLADAFPGYPATLARAAEHQAEAAALLDDLAALDARDVLVVDASVPDVPYAAMLDRQAFVALASRAPLRAKNLLRWFLRQRGLRAPSAARLDAMQRQLVHASADSRVTLVHDGAEIGIHRGRIVVHPPPARAFAAPWRGEAAVSLPHGSLEFTPTEGAGLAAARLAGAPVVIRSRAGGERIRVAEDRPSQAVKRLLQDAGMPHWLRDAIPFVWCGDALAAVPGVGVDVAFAAGAGEPGIVLAWHPAASERSRGKPGTSPQQCLTRVKGPGGTGG
jgi:tRNA(Ile)-lysidine synthase